MLIRKLLLVFATFLLCFFVLPSFAQSVFKCDTPANGNTRVAMNYISQHVQQLADQFTHLSKANRDEFVRKWRKTTIVCQDEGTKGKSRECLNDAGRGGFSHGGLGNQINLCYYNLVDIGETMCGLVMVLVHESGHTSGFPIFADHNNPSANTQVNDPVYKMGNLAKTFCAADTKSIMNLPLAGVSNLTLGATCNVDDQCASGRCIGGTCQCDQDGDCPTGQSCFKPVVGANFCSKTDLALGAVCNRDAECPSDRCEGGHCVCRRDGDCPAGQICRTPVTGANRCEAGSDGTLAIGAVCQQDNQCKSGQCEGDHCVCRSDTDCPTGQSCFTPITGANFCQSTTLGLGAACNRDSQCRSDKCQGGACRCNKDSDCSGSQQCKKPVIGNNHCE